MSTSKEHPPEYKKAVKEFMRVEIAAQNPTNGNAVRDEQVPKVNTDQKKTTRLF